MSGISIGNLPNQSILKKINDIAADVNDLDLEGVNNLKSKLSELVAPELGSSDTKAISQKVVTENIQQLNTEVNNKINKVESAQNGNLPSFDNFWIFEDFFKLLHKWHNIIERTNSVVKGEGNWHNFLCA